MFKKVIIASVLSSLCGFSCFDAEGALPLPNAQPQPGAQLQNVGLSPNVKAYLDAASKDGAYPSSVVLASNLMKLNVTALDKGAIFDYAARNWSNLSAVISVLDGLFGLKLDDSIGNGETVIHSLVKHNQLDYILNFVVERNNSGLSVRAGGKYSFDDLRNFQHGEKEKIKDVIDTKDSLGNTPLNLAVQMYYDHVNNLVVTASALSLDPVPDPQFKALKAMIYMLKKLGADPTIPNNAGDFPRSISQTENPKLPPYLQLKL